MDAKPQRPVRTIRVFGDENVVPSLGQQKTLHQRNKSSPALSSMLNGVGLKAAAKRTAFGDVSNTVNGLRPSKDDSALGIKPEKLKENVPPTQLEKKATSFLRPAQRPLSVNPSVKNIMSNVTNSSVQSLVKQPLVELPQPPQQTSQVADARKITAKKSTTIFKDANLAQSEQSNPDLQKPLPSTAAVAPVHRALPLPPTSNPPAHVFTPAEPHQPDVQEKRVVEAKNEPHTNLNGNKASEDGPALTSNAAYIENHEKIQIIRSVQEAKQGADPLKLATGLKAYPSDAQSGLQNYFEQLPVTSSTLLHPLKQTESAIDPMLIRQAKLDTEQSRRPKLAPVSEPEEYWEEEEAVENYDEEGYVTARSFKSRGENTTGGATTVLFPKVTLKAKKEIAIAKELIEGSKTVEELEDEAWDTTMVAEYGEEIFQYMRDLEIKLLPNAHYMDNQAEIQWSMRAVLMDWIVQVHHRFNLLPETLYLCVNYIDRFLSCKVVSLGKLQLVGATAIFIAAKYEEIDCPSVQEIVYMVDGGYSIDEILKAERFMLSMLQFELGWPGPMSFLRRISKADDYDLETRTLAKYFLEITIMDERFVGSPPSFVAAGAHCLARMMLRKGKWSSAHVYYSDYTYSQLFSLVLLMVECCEDARKHHCAVYDKYTDKRFKRASTFAEAEMKRGFTLVDIASNTSATTANHYDTRTVLAQPPL